MTTMTNLPFEDAEATPQRRMKAEDRREQLLDIAIERFGRFGFDGTTVRDIAADANVTEGLLYRYFASKEALLEEVLERARGELASLKLDPPPDAGLDQAMAWLVQTLAQLHRDQMPLIDLAHNEYCRGSSISPRLVVLRDDACRQVAELLREFLGRGGLRMPDLMTGARLLQCAAFGFAVMNRSQTDEVWAKAVRHYAEHTAALFLHGACPPT